MKKTVLPPLTAGSDSGIPQRSCCSRSHRHHGSGEAIGRCGLWFLLSFLVIAVDQVSKYYATERLIAYQFDPVMPMLNFTLAYNTGAAFSFLSGTGAWHVWFFMGFSVLVSLGLVVWMVRLPKQERMQLCALSLILGGAIGNLIDRFKLGYVIDFIDVYYKNHHWPIFNLADSAITVGTVLLVIDLCWRNSSSLPTK
jgi:signal peptidase II